MVRASKSTLLSLVSKVTGLGKVALLHFVLKK